MSKRHKNTSSRSVHHRCALKHMRCAKGNKFPGSVSSPRLPGQKNTTNDRKVILTTAALVMVCLAIVVAATGPVVLYRSSMAEKQADLQELVQREALVIEATFGHNSFEHNLADHLDLSGIMKCQRCLEKTAFVSEILYASRNRPDRWGDGVVFVVASRDGDVIRFLSGSMHDHHDTMDAQTAIQWESELAEPMRLALSGLSGTIQAKDYRGEQVLAAYAPVPLLGWGIVAKIDMAEMRAPFVAAVQNSLPLAALAIVLGLVVLCKRLNPLIRRSQASEEQALAAIAELRSQKHALDEHSIVGITDPTGEIIYANDKFCQISQYTRAELIGHDHRIVNSGHHPRAFWVEVWRTISAGNVWTGEVCNRAKDGSLYWMDTTIVPFKDADGQITQHVAIRTDITERKRGEEALRSSLAAAESAETADRAKSEFLANMSHEIRTPMTAILGFTENLLDRDQSEADRLDCIDTIRRNGEYLLGLINDILDLSKIEARKIVIERKDCQPCRVVAEVASLMRVRADAKGLPLNIKYIGAIPETIQSDSTRLRQILINLIGNAIKFTEVGSVRLETTLVHVEGTPCLQFDIIDTGCGVIKEQSFNLFRPFIQADASTTREFGGTGLGLTISKRFAELLGGDITIVTTEFGVGSTFRATVATGPLQGVTMLDSPIEATCVAPALKDSATLMSTALQGCRILLAEDGPDNQRLFSFILKKAGADLTIAENGQCAIEAVETAHVHGEPFHCILMDMQMPIMDGYQATRMLRQRGFTGPIVALTAHAMASDRDKCIEAGCDDYATKPIDRVKLVETVARHIRRNTAEA